MSTRALRLAIGIAAYVGALALTPHELAVAKARPPAPLDARSGATLVLYLAAALLVLGALPDRTTSPPSPRTGTSPPSPPSPPSASAGERGT